MVQAEKLLQRMRANHYQDWRMADVETVCRLAGIVITPPRGGGSHYKARRPGKTLIVTIPAHRPIKAVYIRALLALIDGVSS